MSRILTLARWNHIDINKPPKSKQHMVSVVLAEKDGKQVEHSGAML